MSGRIAAPPVGPGVLGAQAPETGLGTVTQVDTAGLATGGPITTTGTVDVPAPAAGVVLSDGSALSAATIGGGLQLASSTLQSQMPKNPQTGNYTIVAGDRGKIVEFTGSSASTITLTAAATLGDGFWCILKHSGTGTTGATKKLAISGTLDGVSNPAVYPGDTRIIQSDGAALTSILLVGGYVELLASDSVFTLTLPTGAVSYQFEAWGGGGSGGSGRRGAAGGGRGGGGGGGGGAYNRLVTTYAGIGASSLTCTIGAAVTGGTAITADDTNGNAGTAGNNTTVGALLTGYGGGGGAGGTNSTTSGGGGGGTLGVGPVGLGGSNIAGGAPSDVTLTAGHFGGGGAQSGGLGKAAGWGGGGGGGQSPVTPLGAAGGSSSQGGSGGGGGGPLTNGNVAVAGGTGGSAVGLNAGGGAGGAATGANGDPGTAGPSVLGPGTGGGGGGSQTPGVGGSGGNGGIACGGGGGAGSLNGSNSGAGGNGGAGLIRFRYGL